MADNFFPYIGNAEDYEDVPELELPLFKEFAYDFKTNDFIIDNKGEFVIWEGVKALETWIYHAILTDRYSYPIYTWDYGTELITLIGQKFSRGLTEAEAYRYVKEALLINPYITDVANKGIQFEDNIVTMNLYITTIYGGVSIRVRR